MKTNIIIATLAACVLMGNLSANSQGRVRFFDSYEKIEASKKTITYELENPERFNRINLAGDGTVEYRQSTDGQTHVTVTVAENVAEYIQVEVKNETLINKWNTGHCQITGDSKLKIVCESPQIEAINVAGSGTIRLWGDIKNRRIALKVAGSGKVIAEHLDMEETIQGDVAGSGEIKINNGISTRTSFNIAGSGDIQADNLKASITDARISGSGDIQLKGSVLKAFYRTTGSGEIHADGFKAGEVYAEITGSGKIHCHVTETLSTKVTGSGEIIYSGNPATINDRNSKTKQTTDTEEVMEGI